MLIETDVPGFEIPWGVIVPVTVTTVAFLLVVIGMAAQARKRPVVSGPEELIGAQGEIVEHANGEWWARVHSESWKVRSHAHLHRGQHVRVTAIEGLTLTVEPQGRNGPQSEQGA
jgi:membrane-bound serine protease (ClpP class)